MSNFSPSVLLEKLDQALEQDNLVNRYLDKIEKKSNIKKRYVAIAAIAFLSVYLVYGYAADLLCNLIGFVYPAYISVKAIESTDKDDDTEWLMYWVVFAVFSVVEFFSDILLSWFPFYYFAKCVFLIWCMLPVSWNGSKYIYTKVVRPFVQQHEENIDNALSRVKEDAVNAVIESGATKEIINRATQAAVHQAVAESTTGTEAATTSAENKKED